MISRASTSSSCNQRPILLIDNVQLKEEEEDECYELMEDEEDDEVGYESQPRETNEFECLEEVNCSTEGTDRKPACSICGRSYSSKYLLFRWPVDHRMRITWAAEIGLREAPTDDNAFICAIHFSSSDFSFINGRIFWEKGSFPRYKSSRPSNEPPFPWERQRTEYPKPNRTEAKLVVDHSNYQVSYRRSFYKNKRRNSHEVAVISKLDTNTYLEFSYNRTSQLDGTKFYSCLGCRKAKAESDVKDVIRTIHIDGTAILSKDDPFYGHHYACFPIQSEPHLKNYRPAIPQPMHMDMGVVYASGDVIYVDEEVNPNESVWDSVDNSSLINLDEIPFYGELSQQTKEPPPKQRSRPIPKQKNCNEWKNRKPKCHLCFLVLPSTLQLIKHLENHVNNPVRCRKCEHKIPVDHLPNRIFPVCKSCKRKNRERTLLSRS
ncbi:unnamed protein product [Auanema sp. JU1783]|nr:unnamed protein product [Auanema sp. JU1783]